MLVDISVLLTALFSGVAAFAAVRASRKVQEVHLQINSRMDELVKLNKALGHAEGVIEGSGTPATTPDVVHST